MATQIYLGKPPAKIVEWIQMNYKPDMTKVPLHFTANEDGSSISLVCYDDNFLFDFVNSWVKLDYSMDGQTWQTYIDPNNEDQTLRRGKVINLNKGETVYFRATMGDVEGNPNLNGFAKNDGLIYHYFVMEGSIKADGNIQFLLENTGTKTNVPDYCYWKMFSYCTSLTQAPNLPATELSHVCYYHMFESCRSLVQAPSILPATTLAEDCYSYMFSGCTSLAQAPALPATTLANYCYSGMFKGCIVLTQAPELPATTLANYCYSNMFENCTSLTQAPSILPATTLAESCYDRMFSGCTALTQAPELPAEYLVDNCYFWMFNGCTNLNNINVNFFEWIPSNATQNWVKNVSSSGTFTCPSIIPEETPALPEELGESRIPTGWTVVRK